MPGKDSVLRSTALYLAAATLALAGAASQGSADDHGHTIEIGNGEITIGPPQQSRPPARVSDLEVFSQNEIFRLDPRSRYLVIAANSSALSHEQADQAAENALFALKDPSRFASQEGVQNLGGIQLTGLQAGASGPIYAHSLSTAQVPLDPRSILALAFCAGGDRNPPLGTYDGIAGAGVSVGLGAFHNELMAGLSASVGTSMRNELTQLIASPYGTFADAVNGWFVSDRFAVRVFKLPEGYLDFVARAQVAQAYGGLDVIGWVGVGATLGN